jgi:hypothetical protein
MESTELHGSTWDLAEAATSHSARVRWLTPLRSAVAQILVWRDALAGPAELWWRSHGRRIVRIVALIAGGIAFLLVAHIVLSLLNPPSGL